MALIILCGLPSSGKTYRARQLVADFERRLHPKTEDEPSSFPQDSSITHDATANPPPAVAQKTVKRKHRTIHYLSDHDLHIPRSAYASAASEKTARATLYAAVKRALGRDMVVVVDSGNYIKGWRYQLHCEAKSLGVRSCVVQVGVAAERARAINMRRLGIVSHEDGEESRDNRGREGLLDRNKAVDVGRDHEESAYDEKVWEELAMRFEEPNGMTRWDSPLFPVVWEDERPPGDRIWNEVVEGIGRDGKALRVVKPNQATVLTPATPPNHLQVLDRATKSVISQIQDHQRANPDIPGVLVSLNTVNTDSSAYGLSEINADGAKSHALQLQLPDRFLSVAYLRRLQSQFVSMHRHRMGGLGMRAMGRNNEEGGVCSGQASSDFSNPERVTESFIHWLEGVFERDET